LIDSFARVRPRLKKRLGQHHLVNPAVVRPLLAFLSVAPGDRVLEVGPGGGLLTRQLLAAGARVWGVELDREWVFALRRDQARSHRAGEGDELKLAVADALELAWERLPPPTLVTGNLPYNVATPLLARVLPLHACVPRAAFLLQKEVAARLTARPGSRAYGALTLLVACHAEAIVLGRVAPGSFVPPPKVDSAFVGLALRPPPLPPPELAAFHAVVRRAFEQKRKTLRNALGAVVGREAVEAALARLGLPPAARAEELPLATWLELWRALERPGWAGRPVIPR
jgi:16S rRNA (adenine1518-N6/adenine1519-N6)-dimethyltransferase